MSGTRPSRFKAQTAKVGPRSTTSSLTSRGSTPQKQDSFGKGGGRDFAESTNRSTAAAAIRVGVHASGGGDDDDTLKLPGLLLDFKLYCHTSEYTRFVNEYFLHEYNLLADDWRLLLEAGYEECCRRERQKKISSTRRRPSFVVSQSTRVKFRLAVLQTTLRWVEPARDNRNVWETISVN